MNAPLLPLGASAVSYSRAADCWLVDHGDIVPLAVTGRHLAYDVAASFVPPVGPSRSARTSAGFATADGAGTTRPLVPESAVSAESTSPVAGGQVPESLLLTFPEEGNDSGTRPSMTPLGAAGCGAVRQSMAGFGMAGFGTAGPRKARATK
jgi:hypothetical protein